MDSRWRDLAVTPSTEGEGAQRFLDLGSERLAAMDEAGIDVAVLSLTTPGVQNLDPQCRRQSCCKWQEFRSERSTSTTLISRHYCRRCWRTVCASLPRLWSRPAAREVQAPPRQVRDVVLRFADAKMARTDISVALYQISTNIGGPEIVKRRSCDARRRLAQ